MRNCDICILNIYCTKEYFDDCDSDPETNSLLALDDNEELDDEWEYEYPLRWANFSYNLMSDKTDRWDARNYTKTDWELYIEDSSY